MMPAPKFVMTRSGVALSGAHLAALTPFAEQDRVSYEGRPNPWKAKIRVELVNGESYTLACADTEDSDEGKRKAQAAATATVQQLLSFLGDVSDSADFVIWAQSALEEELSLPPSDPVEIIQKFLEYDAMTGHLDDVEAAWNALVAAGKAAVSRANGEGASDE